MKIKVEDLPTGTISLEEWKECRKKFGELCLGQDEIDLIFICPHCHEIIYVLKEPNQEGEVDAGS